MQTLTPHCPVKKIVTLLIVPFNHDAALVFLPASCHAIGVIVGGGAVILASKLLSDTLLIDSLHSPTVALHQRTGRLVQTLTAHCSVKKIVAFLIIPLNSDAALVFPPASCHAIGVIVGGGAVLTQDDVKRVAIGISRLPSPQP